MKKWTFICNMTIYANDYECDANDEDEALEMLLHEGLFDNATCTYKFEPGETKYEEVDDYICDAEDPDEALEKLLKDDFFDKTVSTYTFDKVESKEV